MGAPHLNSSHRHFVYVIEALGQLICSFFVMMMMIDVDTLATRIFFPPRACLSFSDRGNYCSLEICFSLFLLGQKISFSFILCVECREALIEQMSYLSLLK